MEYDKELPEWLKNAFREHPDWETVCLESEEDVIPPNYSQLIQKIPQLLKFLPQMIKERSHVLCEEAVSRDINLLKYIPLTVIENHIDYWKPYFGISGIDIEVFKEYDFQIRANQRPITEPQNQGIEEKKVSLSQEDEQFFNLYRQSKEDKSTEQQSETGRKEKAKREFTPEEIKKFMKSGLIYLIPEEVKLANPEWCMEQVKSGDDFKYVPEEIMWANQEWCKSLVELGVMSLYYLPTKIQLANQEWCMQISEKENPYRGFLGLAEEIKIANPEWCMQLIGKKGIDSTTCFSHIPAIVKLTNQDWTISYFKENLQQYLATEFDLPAPMILADEDLNKKYTSKAEDELFFGGKYREDYYGQELNLEEMKKNFTARAQEDMITSIVKLAPMMKRIYQMIDEIQDPSQNGKKQYCFQQANELARRCLELDAKDLKMGDIETTQLIDEVATFEFEMMQETASYADQVKKEAARKEMREKIERIRKMNPKLAKIYEYQLQEITAEEKSQETEELQLPIEQREIQLLAKIDFYLNANLAKEQENMQIAVYKPSLWSRFLNKLNNWKNGRKESTTQDGKQDNQQGEVEEHEQQEDPEFSDMSLEELKSMAEKLEKAVREKEKEISQDRVKKSIGED